MEEVKKDIAAGEACCCKASMGIIDFFNFVKFFYYVIHEFNQMLITYCII